MKTVLLVLLMLSGTLYGGKPSVPLRTKEGYSLRNHTKNINYSNWIASDSDEEYEEEEISTFKKKRYSCKKRKFPQVSEELVNAVFENPQHNYVIQCIHCSGLLQYGIRRILTYNAHNRYGCSKRKKHKTTPYSAPPQFSVGCIVSSCNSTFSGSLKEIKDGLYNHIVSKGHKISSSSDELRCYVVGQLKAELHDELEALKSAANAEEKECEMDDKSPSLYSELEPLFGSDSEIWPNNKSVLC